MTRARALVALLLFVPAVCLAHAGEPVRPHDLWEAWAFDPGILIPLLLSLWLYLRGWRAASGPMKRSEGVAFLCGWAALFIALVSPVHPMGESLFSAHMTQHELLMVVAAPLLVLGRPLVPFLWALPITWRKGLGQGAKSEWIQRPWHFLTNPLSAWIIHALVLWVWHAPSLFQATLTSDLVHTAQHVSFLGSALLFWWAVLHNRTGEAAGLNRGMALLYVFTTAVHTSILGALLTFSPSVWYPAYESTAPDWGLTALEDQQLGGLIMWVPAGLTYIFAAILIFIAWLREAEWRVLQRETERGV
jgi:putative membrane protein